MLKNILGVAAGLVAIAVGLGFVLPDKVVMERDIVINAPQAEVFALVADFNQWERWSPWAKLDPEAEMVVTGAGAGQTMRWSSDKPEVGSGSQTISVYEPPARIKTHLEFGDMGQADAVMQLEPVAEGTHVVWTFESNMREGVPIWMKPVATYMGYFMDGMLGPTYEQGLMSLKAAAEAA